MSDEAKAYTESWADQVARLEAMASEARGDKWDLSPNDRAAIGEALATLAARDRELVSEIKSGPIFRRIDSRSDCYGDKALIPAVVAMKVKEYCEKAGLDERRFAGHSLRSGFATTAAEKGHTLTQIMRQGRWKDERTARTYIRPATIFRDNCTDGLGDVEPKKVRGGDER